jgi:hypothetical protein
MQMHNQWMYLQLVRKDWKFLSVKKKAGKTSFPDKRKRYVPDRFTVVLETTLTHFFVTSPSTQARSNKACLSPDLNISRLHIYTTKRSSAGQQ